MTRVMTLAGVGLAPSGGADHRRREVPVNYTDYYADTMLWTAVITFIFAAGSALLVGALLLRKGSRLAQVACPQGGSALVRYADEAGGCVKVSQCPLRADGRSCGQECSPALERAAARLRD